MILLILLMFIAMVTLTIICFKIFVKENKPIKYYIISFVLSLVLSINAISIIIIVIELILSFIGVSTNTGGRSNYVPI